MGQLLGSFPAWVSPAQVRALALSPGTTMARLLVDPADGRCVERSRATYLMDAAMRAQILAADVTCRAPGCAHTGYRCQVDHVQEHGTGGATSEANGQLLHTGHHEAKTAKAWDAHLAANRDVTWTTLLGRIYRTRAWDYRRYVTVLTDAIDTVASAAPQDFVDELNRQVYLALTMRELGERLNAGDDDPEPDMHRFGGWGLVGLTHTDPGTGRWVPGPSPAATTDAHARLADTHPRQPDPTDPAPGRRGQDGHRPRGADDTDRPGPDAPSGAAADAPEGDPRRPRLLRAPRQDRMAGPYKHHEIRPPHGWTRRDWAAHIRRRTANGENCPPF